MSIIKRKQRLQRLIFMLRHKQLKSANDAAIKLNCHSSTIEKMIRELRSGGYHIIYDRMLRRYKIAEEII